MSNQPAVEANTPQMSKFVLDDLKSLMDLQVKPVSGSTQYKHTSWSTMLCTMTVWKRSHLPCCLWRKDQQPPGPLPSPRKHMPSHLPVLGPGMTSIPISRNILSISMSKMSQSHGSLPPPSQRPYHLEIIQEATKPLQCFVLFERHIHCSWSKYSRLSYKAYTMKGHTLW